MKEALLLLALFLALLAPGLATLFQPTGQPSSQPSISPTSTPTYAKGYIATVDASVPDRPLTKDTDYNCGAGVRTSSTFVYTSSGLRPTTNQATWSPCSLRAAMVYCLTRHAWASRGTQNTRNLAMSSNSSTCKVKFSAPQTPGSVFRVYPQPIELPVDGGAFNLAHIIIDGSGWVLEPGYGNANDPPPTKIFTGLAMQWFTFQFMTTVLSPMKNIAWSYKVSSSTKMGRPSRRSRRALEGTQDEDAAMWELYAPQNLTDESWAEAGTGAGTGADTEPWADNALQMRSSASVSAADGVASLSLSPSGAAFASRLDALQARQQEGGGRGLLAAPTMAPTGSLVRRRISPRNVTIEFWDLTFRNFGLPDPRAVVGETVNIFNGAVMSLANLGTVVFKGVIFDSNVGYAGGAVYLNRTTNVVIDSCVFKANVASSGGAVQLYQVPRATFTNTTWAWNKAMRYQGGAVYAFEVDHFKMYQNVLANNSAVAYSIFAATTTYQFGGHGGALAFADVFNADVFANVFYNNSASFGGAVAMTAVVATYSPFLLCNIRNNTFQVNRARTAGGAIFWVASSGMPAPRRLQYNNYLGNTVHFGYGIKWATEPIRMVAQPQVFLINDYLNRNTLGGQAFIRDYYGQLCIQESGSLALILRDPNSAQEACSYNAPKARVGGNVQSTSTGGVVTFRGWGSGGCIPSRYMNATYMINTQVAPRTFPQLADVSLLSAKTYLLKTDVVVNFRPCGIGEFYDFFEGSKDQCLTCVNGYSFVSNPDNLILTCNKCPILAMECFGNQIVLFEGTWRWQPQAVTIIPCPYGEAACKGGNSTGEQSCNVGYYGPVCGICKWGYFTKNNMCMDCSKVEIMSTQTVIMISLMITFFIYFSYSSAKRWAYKNKKPMYMYPLSFFQVTVKAEMSEEKETAFDRKEKNKIRGFMVRVKIVIATYQVVLQAPTIFNVKMGPLFLKLIDTLSFLNFDLFQILPLQCVQPFHFIESMVSSTLMPVGAVSIMIVFYTVQRLHIMATEKNAVKRRDKLKALFSRYFTMFTSFTYLILPSTCMKILKTFECQDIDPNKEASDPSAPHIFLRLDYAVDCESAYYRFGYNWALGMTLVYPVALPLFNFYLVYISRKEVHQRLSRMAFLRELDDMCDATPEEMEEFVRVQERKRAKGGLVPNTSFVEGIQFLWSSYRADVWFWEIIETHRRLVSTSIMATFYVGTPLQCCFAVISSISYLKVYSFYKPYFDPFDNMMAEFGHYQIFFTFFAIYIIRQQSLGASVGAQFLLDAMTVAVNALVIGAFLSTYVQEFRIWLEKLRKVRGGLPPEETVKHFTLPRSEEQDMELVLTALKRCPTILEQIGQTLGKKQNSRLESKRAALVMSTSSLQSLLSGNATRREGVKMTAEQFQQMMLESAKKKEEEKKKRRTKGGDEEATAGLGLDAGKLAELQEIAEEESSSSSSSSGSSSGSGSSSSSSSSRSSSSSSSRSEADSKPSYSPTDSDEPAPKKKNKGKSTATKGLRREEGNSSSESESESDADSKPSYSPTDSDEPAPKKKSKKKSAAFVPKKGKVIIKAKPAPIPSSSSSSSSDANSKPPRPTSTLTWRSRAARSPAPRPSPGHGPQQVSLDIGSDSDSSSDSSGSYDGRPPVQQERLTSAALGRRGGEAAPLPSSVSDKTVRYAPATLAFSFGGLDAGRTDRSESLSSDGAEEEDGPGSRRLLGGGQARAAGSRSQKSSQMRGTSPAVRSAEAGAGAGVEGGLFARVAALFGRRAGSVGVAPG